MKLLLRIIWVTGAISYSFLLPQLFCRNLRNVGLYKLSLGFLLCIAFFFLLMAVFGSWCRAGSFELVLSLLLSTCNQAVYEFRGVGMSLHDLLSWRTAVNIISSYHFSLKIWWFLLWGLCMFWLILGWLQVFFFWKKRKPSPPGVSHEQTREKHDSIRESHASIKESKDSSSSGTRRDGRLWAKALVSGRLCALLLSLTGFLLINHASREMPPLFWMNQAATRNGYLLNLFLEARQFRLRRPDGYSRETVEALMDSYEENSYEKKLPHEKENTYKEEALHEKKDSLESQDLRPSIFVIMDESFADLGHLGDGLRTDGEVLPFFERVREGRAEEFSGSFSWGYTLSPVFGGLTANSEYEFLTGNSCAFLPPGSIPYHQYVKAHEDSLVRVLKEQGYKTFAMHPFDASGWNRPHVYDALGFDECYFADSFPGKDRIRGYISDRECFQEMLRMAEREKKRNQIQDHSQYEAQDRREERPLFIFGITMQNHGEYWVPAEDAPKNMHLLSTAPGREEAELYLNLVHETDRALEEFLTQVDQMAGPAVVLFFGDHYPALSEEVLEEIHGGPFLTTSEIELRYEVPFLLYCKGMEKSGVDFTDFTCIHTSTSLLGNLLLDAAEIPMDAYHMFLSDFSTHIPKVNPYGYYSVDGNCMKSLDEAEGVEKEWLSSYELWNYERISNS